MEQVMNVNQSKVSRLQLFYNLLNILIPHASMYILYMYNGAIRP